MEQGPVLIIMFQAQVVMVIKNQKGEVVEGDPVSVRCPWVPCQPWRVFGMPWVHLEQRKGGFKF